jgi:hypothetical protein
MAEIVGGLFGVTPESLQAQREAALQEQATKYAQLSPMQAAQAGFYTAGNRLAGAAGGLMGAQDPEMMRIQQRQSMLQNLDLSSPESLKSGIQQAMQNKDYQLVSELTNRYQASAKAGLEAQKTQSEIQKNLREGQTNEMKNAQSAADMSGAARGSEEWNKTFNTKFNELLAKNPSIDNIGVAAGSRMPVYFDKNTNQQFTIKDGQRVAYNGGVDRTTSNVSLSPEIKMANQELDWRKQFLTENKPVVEQGANVRQSLNLLGQTNSPFAQAAFNNTVVSALGGDKQKSNAEIKRLSNTGDVGTRIANTLTNFLDGKNTATTVQDQQDVLNALDKYLSIRYTSSSKGWENRLKQAKVDPSMVVPSYEEVVGTKSAGGQTVNYQGAPASIVAQNADGTIVIEQNGVRKTLAPKKQ